MIDVLTVTYDFIQKFACRNNDLQPYDNEQIIRGWQNSTVLPKTNEFCVLTLLESVRHGTPANSGLVTKDDYEAQFATLVEHVIQADFCSVEPLVLPQQTKLRADLVNTLFFTSIASEFYETESGGILKAMYADDVKNLSSFMPDKLYTARYSTTLHVSEIQQTSFYSVDSFNSLKILGNHIINADNKNNLIRG